MLKATCTLVSLRKLPILVSVQFNVGTFTANLAGSWTATVTLSADVPLGTYYTLVYYPFWDVSEGPPPAGVTFVAGESKELNVGLVPK